MNTGENNKHTHHEKEAGIRTYFTIWLILLLLTIMTILTARMELRGMAVIVCLCIASLKSSLVFLYFMHLRYENRLVVKLIIPIAIITLTLFIGITYVDIITR